MLDAKLPSRSRFTKYSGTTDYVVGIAFNGVPIMAGTGETGFDPFYPKAYDTHVVSSTYVFDICLGNNDYNSFYHYYSMSPCIVPTQTKGLDSGQLCSSSTPCDEAPLTYTTDLLRDEGVYVKLMRMGIAKDGSLIYGPFKDSSGELW